MNQLAPTPGTALKLKDGAEVGPLAATDLAPLAVATDLSPTPHELHADRMRVLARIKRLLLILVVIAPIGLVSFYQLIIAADIYVSEAQFVVRKAGGLGGLGAGAPTSSTAGLAPPSGSSSGEQDGFIVSAFMESRDLVQLLKTGHDLVERMNRDEADILNRFSKPWSSQTTDEALYKHFQDYIKTDFDGGTGIGLVKIRAFRPGDAFDLTTAALQHSEDLINRLSDRVAEAEVEFSQTIVAENQERVIRFQDQLTLYRNEQDLLDPQAEFVASQELIGNLKLELAKLNTRIAQLTIQGPRNPQIEPLRTQRTALVDEIERLKSQTVGNEESLVNKLSEYERIELQKEIAVQILSASIAGLEKARIDSQSERLYLETIVTPNRPDRANFWVRVQPILLTVFLSITTYIAARALLTVTMQRLS